MKKYRQKMAAMEVLAQMHFLYFGPTSSSSSPPPPQVSSRLTQPTSSSLMKVQPPLKQGLAVRPPVGGEQLW